MCVTITCKFTANYGQLTFFCSTFSVRICIFREKYLNCLKWDLYSIPFVDYKVHIIQTIFYIYIEYYAMSVCFIHNIRTSLTQLLQSLLKIMNISKCIASQVFLFMAHSDSSFTEKLRYVFTWAFSAEVNFCLCSQWKTLPFRTGDVLLFHRRGVVNLQPSSHIWLASNSVVTFVLRQVHFISKELH